MVRGIEKRRIVADERDQKDFVLRLGKLVCETRTSIYAWALMSNHAHILLRSGPQGLANARRRALAHSESLFSGGMINENKGGNPTIRNGWKIII